MANKIYVCLIVVLAFCNAEVMGQAVPSSEENIPFLVTFGKNSQKAWGDDDFCQTFFFSIPKDQMKPVFIRVFDPDTGNEVDEVKEKADTKTKFSVFGGKGALTHHDATLEEPVGLYNSGTLLATKTFDSQKDYNNGWYSFGPFNPTEGEYVEEYGGYILKIIAEGLTGNDGNLYKYFLSNDPNENIKVEGANPFTYEYTFRLHDNAGSISHIYPFISKDVVSIEVHTFDFDSDGWGRIVSVAKKSEPIEVSGDNNWITSKHQISLKEKNTSLDIQLIKKETIKNNNVVFYIKNQYGTLLPFYTSPIGGIPKYSYKISVRPQR